MQRSGSIVFQQLVALHFLHDTEHKLAFTPCKVEQPLQKKKEDKDEKHVGKLFRKIQKIKGVC